MNNHLHPRECLQYPCADDRLQACGGDDAISIYDGMLHISETLNLVIDNAGSYDLHLAS